MMLTCHTVNSSLMNTAAVKTLPYKFNGKQVDEETGLYYMVQDDTFNVFLWLFNL